MEWATGSAHNTEISVANQGQITVFFLKQELASDVGSSNADCWFLFCFEFWIHVVFCFLFESGSCFQAQAGLELVTPLVQEFER